MPHESLPYIPQNYEEYLEYDVDSSFLNHFIDSLNLAKLAYNEGHLHTAIAHSTKALKDLMEIKNMLLAIRMKAYNDQGEFYKAYTDAKSLEMTFLGETRRFVHMARFLFKDQRMLDVIETSDRLIDVPNIYWYSQWGIADLMSRLPHDIITLILDKLSLDDILNCMDVARHWRQHITQCPTTSTLKLTFRDHKRIEGEMQSSLYYKYLQQLSARKQQSYPSLTHLRICADHSENEDIKRALELAVNLQDLTIRDLDLYPFQEIQQYGKHLRHITINPHYPDATHISLDDDYLPINKIHFKYSIDTQNCYNTTAQTLLPILNNMEQKVEALSILVNKHDNTPDKWSPFINIQLPSLRYIKLSFTQETKGIFSAIIRQCPSLEEIFLFELQHIANTILSAITLLPTLRSLSMENVCEYVQDNIAVNDSTLRKKILHHVRIKIALTLQHVHLCYIFGPQPETIKALFKINHLKTIRLAGLDYIDSLDMDSVLSSMDGSFLPSKLETLVLQHLFTVTDSTILSLDCTKIKFKDLENVTTEGIRQMIKRTQKLKKVIINDCYQIDEDELVDLAKEEHIQISLGLEYIDVSGRLPRFS
ncbi:hypothetical protein BDA99DRAFT_556711 [Phascolomyces articulosus]|uniref:F-box domain-containing protein n=1 Tax=Phascolomyces articulosus TaxID=60185 RepID=A0AAD5KHH3_9FUNG|nr:hypothetical protein BDA99DRAFT_556711 [Phascolomyces articulosus]